MRPNFAIASVLSVLERVAYIGKVSNDSKFLFWTAETPDLAADLVNDRITVHVTVPSLPVACLFLSPQFAVLAILRTDQSLPLNPLPSIGALPVAMSVSVSASLKASARAAYRDLLRAASVTFQGDPTVQNGMHHSGLGRVLSWC